MIGERQSKNFENATFQHFESQPSNLMYYDVFYSENTLYPATVSCVKLSILILNASKAELNGVHLWPNKVMYGKWRISVRAVKLTFALVGLYPMRFVLSRQTGGCSIATVYAVYRLLGAQLRTDHSWRAGVDWGNPGSAVNECASRIQWQATETVDDRLLIDAKGGWYRFSRKLDDCNARRLVFF